MNHVRSLAVCSLAFLTCFGLGRAAAAELNIFAAASLADALREISPTYEAQTGDKLRFAFGASSTLARRIKEGAPADVFFSADEAKMDDLAAANVIIPATRLTLLSNTLVIVVHRDGGADVSSPVDLAGPTVRRLALGETTAVPAGIYAREFLAKVGVWEKVRAKVVALDNARATLAAVEAGNADAGIVYRTDAQLSKHVKIAYLVPASEGPKIGYPLAVTTDSREPAAARRLVEYLTSPQARAVFLRRGFLPAD